MNFYGDAIPFGLLFLGIWVVLGVIARNLLHSVPKIGRWFEGFKGIFLGMIAGPLVLLLMFGILILVFGGADLLNPASNVRFF